MELKSWSSCSKEPNHTTSTPSLFRPPLRCVYLELLYFLHVKSSTASANASQGRHALKSIQQKPSTFFVVVTLFTHGELFDAQLCVDISIRDLHKVIHTCTAFSPLSRICLCTNFTNLLSLTRKTDSTTRADSHMTVNLWVKQIPQN